MDLEEFLKKVLNEGNVMGILLFGSLSKGMARPYPESNIDLIIIADNLEPDIFERRMSKLKLKERPMAIEDLWLTEEELINGIRGGWGLLLDALSDGIPLYDPKGILKKAKRMVEEKYERMGRIWILSRKMLKIPNKLL